MPTYDYECSECGYYKEVFQKFSDKPLVKCPQDRDWETPINNL